MLDYLGNWCLEGWWGHDVIAGKAGRYPWQPSEQEPPCMHPPIGTVTQTESVENMLTLHFAYLDPYIPRGLVEWDPQ